MTNWYPNSEKPSQKQIPQRREKTNALRKGGHLF
jgi:hypothetical protein